MAFKPLTFVRSDIPTWHLGCCLRNSRATFVVLPALVSLADQNVEPRKLPTPFQGDLLRKLTSRFPLVVCWRRWE